MIRCTHCRKREIESGKAVWLDRGCRSDRWYPSDTCPPEDLDGQFPFSASCARKVLRKQEAMAS